MHSGGPHKRLAGCPLLTPSPAGPAPPSRSVLRFGAGRAARAEQGPRPRGHPAPCPQPEARAGKLGTSTRCFSQQRTLLQKGNATAFTGKTLTGAPGWGRGVGGRAPCSVPCREPGAAGPRASRAARLAEHLVPVEHRLPLLLHLQLPPLLGTLHAPQDGVGPGGPAGGRGGSRGAGVLRGGGKRRVCPCPGSPVSALSNPDRHPTSPRRGSPRPCRPSTPACPVGRPAREAQCCWICGADPARPRAWEGAGPGVGPGPQAAHGQHSPDPERWPQDTVRPARRTRWGLWSDELHHRPPGQQVGQAGGWGARLGAAQLGTQRTPWGGDVAARGRLAGVDPAALHVAGRPPPPVPFAPSFLSTRRHLP